MGEKRAEWQGLGAKAGGDRRFEKNREAVH